VEKLCRLWCLWILAFVAGGCGASDPPPVDTGARDATRTYCGAIVNKNWSNAYALLHHDIQARQSKDEFTLLAQAYRQGVGFDPTEFRIRSCEEHGNEATAQIMLVGRTGSKQRYFKDAVVLRNSGTGWKVILPPQFGQGK
jgi:hypothetical protein